MGINLIKYDLELNENDVYIFYNLKNHLSEISSNVGIVGDYEKYAKYKQKILKKYKNKKDITIIDNKTSLRIIEDGIETNFIWLSNIEQLYNKTFKKYV